ncbi:unnamed protein product [Durusdinium trenchii]|uniref:FCP1 homology domain-containing protein n=1 Tax=Durusdinium trenchii TaxID=1381693 RepID=A0ABP0I835_9DINO
MSWLPPRFWQPKIDFEATGKGLVVDLGEEVPLFVSLRPGALNFVSWLKSREDIDLAVYTAGTEPYAKQTLKKLGLEGEVGEVAEGSL